MITRCYNQKKSWFKRIVTGLLCVMMIVGLLPMPSLQVSAASSVTTYNYTGSMQSFTAPSAGVYKFRLWGAGGGGSSRALGGVGGYTEAQIKLKKGETVYLLVGEGGAINGGNTFGGGGSASGGAGSGGGASAVLKTNTSNLQSAITSNNYYMIAGGGGGLSPSGTSHSFRGTYKIGCGGGQASNLGNFGTHTWEYPSDKFGLQHSYLSETYGNGGNGSSGKGAGGGGYYGGTASKVNFAGGAGGSGMIIIDTRVTNGLTKFISDGCTGNGKIEVERVADINVKIKIVLECKGSFNGSGNVASYEWTVPGCSTNIGIPDPVPALSTTSFTGWTKVSGEDWSYNSSTKTASVGISDIVLRANFTSTGITFNKTGQNDNRVSFQWADDDASYYMMYSAVDPTTDNLDSSQYGNQDESDIELPMPGTLTEITASSTYTVPITGWYYVSAIGGKGGNAQVSSGSHSPRAGANGVLNYRKIYLRAGQVLSIETYAGGARTNYQDFYSGAGGTGIGVKADGGVILSSGGGGGASSCYKFDDGACYWDGSGGGGPQSSGGRFNSVTTGQNGRIHRFRAYCNEGLMGCRAATGGGGGGYPYGGASLAEGTDGREQVAGLGGQSWYVSTYNGKVSQGIGIQDGQATTNASGTPHAWVKLISTTCAVTTTSGTYTLYDKKAPYTPEAAGQAYTSDGNGNYFVDWNAVTDIGSENIFQIKAYNASFVQCHISDKIGITYTSGLRDYLWIADTSPGTVINSSNAGACTSTTATECITPSKGTVTYLHVAARDRSGNISGTLTIEMGAKLIVYNKNNVNLQNIYGDLYSTQAEVISGASEIASVLLYPGDSTKIQNNINYDRYGYDFEVNSECRTAWNTKPDGTGTWYYGGDDIDFSSISGGRLELYLVWDPIVSTMTYDYNDPVKGNSNPEGSNVERMPTTPPDSVTGKSSTLEYTYRFDQPFTILSDPALVGWKFMGWYCDGKKVSGNYVYNQSFLSDIPKDTFVQAAWYCDSYYFTYNKNTPARASSAVTGSMNYMDRIQKDVDYRIRNNNYSLTGWTFKGWDLVGGDNNVVKYPNNGTFLANTNMYDEDGLRIVDFTFYSVWQENRYTILFDGNNDTGTVTGSTDAMISILYEDFLPLSPNGFNRTSPVNMEYRDGEWRNIESDFLGWNYSTDDGQLVVFENEEVISKLSATNNSTVILYAVWNDNPTFDIKQEFPDRYFTVADAQSGAITEEELLSTVTGSDREGVRSIELVGYVASDYTGVTGPCVVSQTYKITDTYGRISYVTISVHILENESAKSATEQTVRKYDKEYYKYSDGQFVEISEGGLAETSRWLTDDVYNAILEYTVLSKGTSDNVVYSFSASDLEDIRNHVLNHGIGTTDSVSLSSVFLQYIDSNRKQN